MFVDSDQVVNHTTTTLLTISPLVPIISSTATTTAGGVHVRQQLLAIELPSHLTFLSAAVAALSAPDVLSSRYQLHFQVRLTFAKSESEICGATMMQAMSC